MASPSTRTTILRPDARPPESGPELPPLRHFIAGSFDSRAGAATDTLVNPANGEPVASVPRGGTTEVDAAVAAARAALPAWRRTTPRQRADILLEIAARIDAAADELRLLEALDTGKPHAVTEDDIGMASDVFRFCAGAARAFSEVGSAEYVENHTSIMLREPVGVVAAIVPWNYPLLMAAWKMAPILAAGNTLVIKPAEQTPLTLLRLTELIADLLPAGVHNVVLGRGGEVGSALSTHPGVDMVALTGSVASGRAVATSAGESVKRVHLELGGKAPLVIFEDADLELAAEGIRAAGFWNSGQECGAGTRVLVHESVAARFSELLAAQVATIATGDPAAGDAVELGPLISEQHAERVSGFISRAIDDGAQPLVGGPDILEPGYFVAPTVLTGVKPDSEASREEIFGPVVTIETFATAEEAVARANDVEYGLAASVWTSDVSKALEIPRQLDFGTVWVNSHLVLASEVPWGGFKGSGYGRDLSAYALQDFSRTKHVQINHAGA